MLSPNKRKISELYRGHTIIIWNDELVFFGHEFLIVRNKSKKFIEYCSTSYASIHHALAEAKNTVNILIDRNGHYNRNPYPRRKESREYKYKRPRPRLIK